MERWSGERPRTRGGLACLLALTALVVSACRDGGTPPTPLVLNDFETPADLEAIVWRCRTTFARSEAYQTHGCFGLQMTCYPPDTYPGLRLRLPPSLHHWQGYRYLALDVINPDDAPLSLGYRIDDREHPDNGDWANGRLRLDPGINHLRLDLEGLRTSGSKRPLALERIQSVSFFHVSPPRPLTVGIDYIRLETVAGPAAGPKNGN